MATLSTIHLYPIKSTAGRMQESAWVGVEGIVGDRRFMVAKPDGTFLTARTHPQLQRVTATFDGQTLSLSHPQLPALELAVETFDLATFATTVWADDFDAWTTHARLDAWFSEVAGEPARLLWLGEQSPRYRRSIEQRVSFADGYPLLLISEASLADLNTRTAEPHRMAQFRPNLVIAGTRRMPRTSGDASVWARSCSASTSRAHAAPWSASIPPRGHSRRGANPCARWPVTGAARAARCISGRT